MVNRGDVKNAFEFVVIAGARARQLMRGCTPRVDAPEQIEKKVRIAQKEVATGVVRKLERDEKLDALMKS